MSNNRQIVLITGGNTGIGYYTAKHFLSSSAAYSIVITSRSLSKAEEAVKTLGDTDGVSSGRSEVLPFEVDQEKDEDIEAVTKYVQDKFGRLDILINNAGVNLDMVAPTQSSRARWLQTFNINVVSTHLLTKSFIPLLLKSSAPQIIFLSSGVSQYSFMEFTGAGINASPAAGWPKERHLKLPAYRSSKIAVNMMAKEWYKELKEDKVKVHLLDPGLVATDFGGNPAAEKIKFGSAHDPTEPGELIWDISQGKFDQHQGRLISYDGALEW